MTGASTPFGLDEDLIDLAAEAGHAGVYRIWEPPGTAVVLGRSNRVGTEVHLAACDADGIPVLRRLGGGGAVVLAPGCVVLSLAKRVRRPTAVRRHIEETVQLVQRCLRGLGGPATCLRGTGDLCAGDRKLLGSSVFRRRDLFFYQASLLVDSDLTLVDKYLCHPSREPAYRGGRSHAAFLTTLHRVGMAVSTPQVRAALVETLRQGLASLG